MHKRYAVWQTRGLVPSRLATVINEEGKPCTTVVAQQQQWRRHFTKILNIHSQFSEAEIMKARQRPMRHQLADKPSMDELTSAIGRLKNGKAGGLSGILPEMVKAACCEEDFLELLLDLVQMVWKESKVPKD